MRNIYGSLALESETCPSCGDRAFVLDGRMACCGAEPTRRSSGIRRESGASNRRQIPSREVQAQILTIQHGRCIYCGSVFGDVAVRGSLVRNLAPCWDHVEPFAWQSNNQPVNFVAACSICNGIKGSRVFKTLEEATIVVYRRRKAKGWTSATEELPDSPMRELRRGVPDRASSATVLHRKVQASKVGDETSQND